jgi:hypothetical protein
LQIVTQFLALTAKEGMMLPVGAVMDLVDLEKERRGMIEKEDD